MSDYSNLIAIFCQICLRQKKSASMKPRTSPDTRHVCCLIRAHDPWFGIVSVPGVGSFRHRVAICTDVIREELASHPHLTDWETKQ